MLGIEGQKTLQPLQEIQRDKADDARGEVGSGARIEVSHVAQGRLSCPMAERFAARAVATGTRAQVLQQDLSHREINDLF